MRGVVRGDVRSSTSNTRSLFLRLLHWALILSGSVGQPEAALLIGLLQRDAVRSSTESALSAFMEATVRVKVKVRVQTILVW